MAAEGPAMRQALVDGERGNVSMKGDDFAPVDVRGVPLMKISCAAAELIPTVQYGNVTVGPVTVTRWVTDLDDQDDLLEKINWVINVCERAVAGERRNIQTLMRHRADTPA